MKRKFKLADGTVGSLDTDTGEFTPGEPASASVSQPQQDSGEPHFPMPGYENVPPEKGLIHEDPIGDMLIGNKVAKAVPALLGAAGGAIGRAGASATERLAARTAEEEAARLAAKAAPKPSVSPVRKLGNALTDMVDLHHPLRPAMNVATRLAEGPVDRALASPAMARLGSRATAMAAVPGMRGAAMLLYLMGHGGDDGEQEDPNAR